MRIDLWDTVFIRARRIDVHPLVVELFHAPDWWPGLEVEEAAAGLFRVTHRPFGRRGRGHRVAVKVVKIRPDKGMVLAYHGDLAGRAELFYLDEADGVTVHYLLGAEVDGRGRRRLLAAHRASARGALNRLKDLCEAGRRPGEEPARGLVEHQRRAATELRPRGGRDRTDAIREQR